MTFQYPYSDTLGDPENQAILDVPNIMATALASQFNRGEQINLTDFNQNYASSMFTVPNAASWTGNEQRWPNVTTYTPNFPKPSAIAEWFRNSLVNVQDLLVGTP